MKSPQSCSKDKTQGISSGSSNLWQFLKIKIKFIIRVLFTGGSRKLVSHISISRLAFNTAHNQRARLTQKGPHSRILFIILYLPSYHHSMLLSQGIAHHSRILIYWQGKHVLCISPSHRSGQKHNKYRLELLHSFPPCSFLCYMDPRKTQPTVKNDRWVMKMWTSDYDD